MLKQRFFGSDGWDRTNALARLPVNSRVHYHSATSEQCLGSGSRIRTCNKLVNSQPSLPIGAHRNEFGWEGWIRTTDILIQSQALYR